MMPFEIIYNTPKPTVITMGQAPKVIDPEPEKAIAAAVPIPDPPLEPEPKNKGRTKKMAKEKDLSHESGGPETIRKDDAGEQGAIGSHGENAPAQTKVPESGEGDKGGADNG